MATADDPHAALRKRVHAALATVRDADGVAVVGEGRVLAYRDPAPGGHAVIIMLDDPA